MIICLYHGSSFKDVNEKQTRPITNQIKNTFKTNVYEAYYSKHVCKLLKRRHGLDMSLECLLKEKYQSEKEIYILATNIIDGEEYQNILSEISEIDIDKKIKITKPLLDETTIYDVAKAIKCENQSVVYVGHGSNRNNNEYKRLNELLKVQENYAITLKEDFILFLKETTLPSDFTLAPLMLTSGYHVKIDIDKRMLQVAQNEGYNPNVHLEGLCANKQVVDILINNLTKIYGIL